MKYEIMWQKGTGPKWRVPITQPSDSMALGVVKSYTSAGHIPIGAQVELWSNVGQSAEHLVGWWEVMASPATLSKLHESLRGVKV